MRIQGRLWLNQCQVISDSLHTACKHFSVPHRLIRTSERLFLEKPSSVKAKTLIFWHAVKCPQFGSFCIIIKDTCAFGHVLSGVACREPSTEMISKRVSFLFCISQILSIPSQCRWRLRWAYFQTLSQNCNSLMRKHYTLANAYARSSPRNIAALGVCITAIISFLQRY